MRPPVRAPNRGATPRIRKSNVASPFEYRKQKPDLGIDFRRICYGLSDFPQDKGSIAFAKTVDCYFQRPFGGAHLACELA